MIYHTTYISGTYKVKGYIAFPSGFYMSPVELQEKMEQFYEADNLPLTTIASSTGKDRKSLLSHKLPAFIYCRGGIGKVGRVKTDWVEQFANHGYIVFAPCYRGNEGGEGRDEFGGAENEDVLSAHRFLRSLPFVDENRISIMGFSRGAINAALTAAALPDIHTLTLWGGVSHLAQTYEERIDLRRMLKRVVGGSPAKVPDAYTNRSPICMAHRITCPALIMHGTEDVQVDFQHGFSMYQKLQELGHKVELHQYAGLGHHLPPHVYKEALYNMFQWIRQQST